MTLAKDIDTRELLQTPVLQDPVPQPPLLHDRIHVLQDPMPQPRLAQDTEDMWVGFNVEHVFPGDGDIQQDEDGIVQDDISVLTHDMQYSVITETTTYLS